MSNQIFRTVIQYARMNWPVFQRHLPGSGDCASEKPECQNVEMHPALHALEMTLDKSEQAAEDLTESAEVVAAKGKADLIAKLEAKAFDWIARGLEANIELGRVFNQIKNLVGHGNWEQYYETKFAPHSVAFRTAQEYMRLAREADEVTKNANSALFPPATDPQAQAINDATEKAKAAVAAAGEQAPETSKLEPDEEIKKTRKERVRLDGIYKLPLYMTGDQKEATDQLLESQNWCWAEMEIMDLLQRLHIKYGIVDDPDESEADPAPGAAADVPHEGNTPDEESADADTLP